MLTLRQPLRRRWQFVAVTLVIVGPILAALFVTVWEMFGVAFRDVLPQEPTPPSAS